VAFPPYVLSELLSIISYFIPEEGVSMELQIESSRGEVKLVKGVI
jgi:hypothetical protein